MLLGPNVQESYYIRQGEIKNFFSTSRYLPDIPRDYSEIFPTMQEADYLRLVARRVVLQGYIPQVYLDAREQIEKERRGGDEEEECICEEREEGEPEEQEQQEMQEGEEQEGCVCEEGSQDVDMDENEYRRFLETFM